MGSKMKLAQEKKSENKIITVFISNMNSQRQHQVKWFSIKGAMAPMPLTVADYNRPEGAGC